MSDPQLSTRDLAARTADDDDAVAESRPSDEPTARDRSEAGEAREPLLPPDQSERFAEWCVVPFSGPDGNDRPVLCVVPAQGADRESVERDFRTLRASVPPRLRVQGLTVVDSLPRNPLGKVRRRELAHQLQATGDTA